MHRPRPLRVAVAQFVVTADLKANFEKIERYARRARARKANLVLMPECCLTGYPPVTGLSLDRRTAVAVEGYLKRIQALARQLHLWIIFGSARPADGRWFNSAFVIRPTGRLALTYDKLHLVHGPGGDLTHFSFGQRLPVFRIGRARCAVLICLDLRYPEPFRYLKAKGVRAVFMPFYVVGKTSRWKLPVLEGTLRCRAAENGFYLIGSNVAGPDHAMLSRACDPNGCSIGEAKLDRESLFVATLDLSVTSNFLYPGRRTDLFEMRAKKSL